MTSAARERASTPPFSIDGDDSALGRETLRRASLRLIPLLFVLFLCNFVDRTNLSVAALTMNRDLRISATAYGFGAGIFFAGYSLFEVPSNLILARVGARRWIARIMISWGLVASAMMFIRTPTQLYVLRFLLGVAEAGFFPGIVFYLSQWFPAPERARAMSRFMLAVPLSAAIGTPFSAFLLNLDGRLGLAGWQWVFIVEGIPSVLIGVAVFWLLPDGPSDAPWLSPQQRDWLTARLARDREAVPHTHVAVSRALTHPVVWVLALLYFLMMTNSFTFSFWAPTIIRDALQVGNVATGLITGAIACTACIAMIVVGRHSDRHGERHVHAGISCAVAALGGIGAALLPNPIARVCALALMPIGVYSFLAPFWCIPAAMLGGTAAAAGIALINAVGTTGGFVGPYAVGFLKDLTGNDSRALVGLASTALAASVLCFVLRSRARAP